MKTINHKLKVESQVSHYNPVCKSASGELPISNLKLNKETVVPEIKTQAALILLGKCLEDIQIRK